MLSIALLLFCCLALAAGSFAITDRALLLPETTIGQAVLPEAAGWILLGSSSLAWLCILRFGGSLSSRQTGLYGTYAWPPIRPRSSFKRVSVSTVARSRRALLVSVPLCAACLIVWRFAAIHSLWLTGLQTLFVVTLYAISRQWHSRNFRPRISNGRKTSVRLASRLSSVESAALGFLSYTMAAVCVAATALEWRPPQSLLPLLPHIRVDTSSPPESFLPSGGGQSTDGPTLRFKSLEWAQLRGIRLSGADLSGVRLIGADLRGAELSGITTLSVQGDDAACTEFPDEKQNRLNLAAADLTAASLAGADLRCGILRRAILIGATMDAANMLETDLLGADFSSARLPAATLSRANARGANFSGALAGGTDFQHADLTSARFNEAGLLGARFIAANLRGADFSYADMRASLLVDSDLTESRGIPEGAQIWIQNQGSRVSRRSREQNLKAALEILSDGVCKEQPLRQFALEGLPAIAPLDAETAAIVAKVEARREALLKIVNLECLLGLRTEFPEEMEIRERD